MLHDMLRAAAATEDRLIGEAKTARLLRRLPLADLYKLATTGSLEEPGAEAPDGDSWVLRFAGTPLAGAATELATHELELDTQIAQNRSLSEGVLAQKDQLAIQKRLLEIELVRAQTAEAEKAQAEEAAAAEQQPAAPEAGGEAAPPAAPPGAAPGGDPAASPKTAGYADTVKALMPNRGEVIGSNVGGVLGLAGGLAHGLQKDEEGKRHWVRGIAEGVGGSVVGGHLGGTVGGTVSRVRDGAGVLEGVKGHYAGLGDRYGAAYRMHKGTYVPPLDPSAPLDVEAAVQRGAAASLNGLEGGVAPVANFDGLGRTPTPKTNPFRNKVREHQEFLEKGMGIPPTKTAAITDKAIDALKKGLATDRAAVSAAARRHLADVEGATKPTEPEKKEAGLLDSGRALLSRGHELVTGSGVHALEGKARELGTTLEGKTRELTNARDVALHRSGEAERILSRGPSLYKGKVVLPEPTREARMRAAREVNEHGATAERLGKEIADTTASTNKAIADTHAAAEAEKRKVMGTRVGLVAAPVALGTLAASSGTPAADPTKIAYSMGVSPGTFEDELSDAAMGGDFGPRGVDSARRAIAETVGAYRGFADDAKKRLDASNAHPTRHQLGTGAKGGLAGAAFGGLLGGLAGGGRAAGAGALAGGVLGGGIGLYRGAPSSRAHQHKTKTEHADRLQEEAAALEAQGLGSALNLHGLRLMREGLLDTGDRERIADGLLRQAEEERLRGKTAMVGQALQGLLSGRAGKVVNFALEHPTAAAGIAGGAVGGLGGALSTDAQGHHSLGRTLAGAAGGAAAGAGAQQAYANRGAISEAAQKAVAGIKSRFAGAKPAAVVDPGAGI